MSEQKKKEEKVAPSKTLGFEYKGVAYELKFPNTGKLMDISVMKAKMLQGTYGIIADSELMGDMLSQFSADTIAHLTVLCPDLLKNLNVQSYSELELVDMKELINVYLKNILPWMNSHYNMLNSLDSQK